MKNARHARIKVGQRDASVRRPHSRQHADRCYFVSQPSKPPLEDLPLDLPASLRLARQRPSLFRARGCLLPPGLGTWGILPALRSVICPLTSLLLGREVGDSQDGTEGADQDE